MKPFHRLGAAALIFCVLLGLAPAAGATAPMMTPPDLTVLFTHDTHDHFYPDASGVGGYTRLATAIKTERAKAQCPTVTLDAGDFSMGSLFQTIYASDAPELLALGQMGYDVTTFGNHEFDYRQQGLADMLNAAKDKQATQAQWAETMDISSGGQLALPAIVQANYVVPQDPADPAAQALSAAFERYPVTDYTVLEREGVKVAVFGVMGADSDACAPMSGMVYEPMIDAARRVVAEIKETERPDYIICLSHAGTVDGKGEDYELARAVDGIDLIISGHTHTTLDEPLRVNDTLIVSCGPYTRNLGVLTLRRSPADYSVWDIDYRLVPLDDSVAPDPDMTALAAKCKENIDLSYLSGYGLEYDGVLTHSGADFTTAQTGDLIGRAYIETIRDIEGADYDPISFAVAPAGVVRGSIAKGAVTTAQAFDILSLGSGADGSPGYPLVSVYLTGKDMKNVFEVDASVSALMPTAQLFGAGSWWQYNSKRMFLDRVFTCQVGDDYGAQAGPFADKKLYRVVADLYSGQMLSEVKAKSFGLLSITPRDKDGEPITNLEDHILHDAQGRELKAWQVFAQYLDAQETLEPPQPSKTDWPSWNPVALLIPMGWPTAVAALVVLAVLLAVILVVRRAVRRRKKRRDNT